MNRALPETPVENVEPDRVPRLPILVSVLSLVAAAALILWSVWEFQSHALRARQGPPTIDVSAFRSKEHWLAQREQLKHLRRQEEARLSSYGWVDRDKGIARIPIDRAIEILAAQRAPAVESHP